MTMKKSEVADTEETYARCLAHAAEYIDAVDLGDGRWAYYADETSRWYTLDESDLAELFDYLDHPDLHVRRDAYSHWCAGSAAEEMPEGWEPNHD